MPDLSQAQLQSLVQEGLALHRQGKLAQAQDVYRRILAVAPAHFDALNLLGSLALQAGDFAAAEDLIGRALAVNPSVFAALINRGVALLELKRPVDALASFDAALALDPNRPQGHCHRGDALQKLRRAGDALGSYDRALALKPDYAEAWNNRGSALLLAGQADVALTSYERALALDPQQAEYHYNRGNALRDLRRMDDAVASYDRAIALKPDHALAYNNRGHALAELRRLDDAVASYERAWTLDPDQDFVLGTLVHTRMKLCDWQDLPQALARLKSDICLGKKASVPFPLLALLDEPQMHLWAAQIYADSFPARTAPIVKAAPAERIRIGYFSSDFRMHAMGFLLAELFESHDRARFEVSGFAFGPQAQDEMRRRLAAAFEHFFDVGAQSDEAIAQLARERGIDIAVDLNAYTEHLRPGIFAARCAPIQVNYLGYPGTMGAGFIDYILADDAVIPEEQRSMFTEKVVTLPHCYQANDSLRKIAERVFTRSELGLPERGFVFCSFNNHFKILPETYDIWMRLLQAVEGSVLWLLEGNPTAVRNLRKEAETRGIEGRRLVFAPRLPPDQHLARHRAAALFLDTLPYNAHTTASDALWTGLPLLTCVGASFASRVGASLLTAVGLPELITHTAEAYEAKALALATDPAMIAGVRQKLATNRITSPLFDGKRIARHIEAACTAMYERSQAGLPPDHIRID